MYNCDKKRANRPEESDVGRTPKRFTNLVTHNALGGLTEQKCEAGIDCGPKRVVNLDIQWFRPPLSLFFVLWPTLVR